MKKIYLFHKNKAFILVYTIFIIFLVISFILLSQLVVNSKTAIYLNTIKYDKSIKEIDFLDSIINKELKTIEMYMHENRISKIENFFDSSINNNKIYLLSDYDNRISTAGYRIIDDSENINYSNFLKQKLNENLKDNINLHFIKTVKIENEEYSIYATINYKTNYSKKIEDLKEEKLKRIWIKKND